MTDLRIVFMGTPEFAVGVLNSLIDHKFKVVAVITAADKPSGRGRKLNQSAVKKYALEKDIPVLQPTNLKSNSFLKTLETFKANLQVVVAFRMLPKAVWKMPELGTFNLHASLLPAYRGAAPINWAIINGEKTTGTTTFFIDETIDTGEIILQNKIPIEAHDTAGDLHDKLMIIGGLLVVDTVKLIERGAVKTKKQPKKEHSLAPKLFKETCKIDWNQSIDNIYDKIRGLSPYPAAWTYIDNGDQTIEAKIYNCRKEFEKHSLPIGHIQTTKKELRIAVKKGFILIEELKLPGKRKMAAFELLNGFEFLALAKAR